jgi:hypothetical protein
VEKEKVKKGNKKRKRLLIILLSFLLFVISVLAFLQAGVIYQRETFSHFTPNYPKIDIMPLLKKESRTEEEYDTLYRQTGLTKLAIDDYIEAGEEEDVLRFQNFLFEKHKIYVNHFNPFTYQEELADEYAPICRLQDGDIFVTATTRVSWLRYGHAALVVDGEERTILESVGPNTLSAFDTVECLSIMANFIILRPKVDKEIKAQVVDFAKNNLVGIPYRFTVGLSTKKFDPSIKATQ